MPSGVFLLTQINSNAIMDTQSHADEVWYEITYPFPNFNGYIVEVWEWISNFIPYFILDVILHTWIKLIHVCKRASDFTHFIPVCLRPFVTIFENPVSWHRIPRGPKILEKSWNLTFLPK